MARVSSLRTERKFKKTEIGEIPVDWEVGTLKDYAYIKGRIGWRGLKASEYTEKGPFLIANKHIIAQRVIWDICDHISKFRYEESPEIQLKIHDIIMSKDGTIGQVAYMDDLPDKATINSTMMLIRVDNLKLNPKFLYFFFQCPHFKSFIQLKILGSSVPHIFQRDMQYFTSVIPPVVEQKKIAEILTTVDEAIEKSNEIIKKTKKLKKGLMQELLTCGIGHKKFKKTKIGEIPVDWEVVNLSDVLNLQGGFAFKSKDYKGKGVPLVRISNITSNGVVLNECAYLPYSFIEEFSDFVLGIDDVLVAMSGATTGKIGIVSKKELPALFNQRVGRFMIRDSNSITKAYIGQVVLTEKFKQDLLIDAVGGAQPNVSGRNIERISISLPPLPEQKKIAEILSIVDEDIVRAVDNKKKLETIKKGLMQVLLTGKVRVRI